MFDTTSPGPGPGPGSGSGGRAPLPSNGRRTQRTLIAVSVVGIATLCGLVTAACYDRRARLGQHRSGLSASCDVGGCGYGSCDCGSDVVDAGVDDADAWVDVCLPDDRPSWCGAPCDDCDWSIDAGVPLPDGGSGVPYPDAGSGVPYPDAGSGVPYPDAGSGAPFPDAGSGAPYPDAGSGVPYPDAGSGAPYPDAGSGFPFPDAGSGAPPDAGLDAGLDGGMPDGGPRDGGPPDGGPPKRGLITLYSIPSTIPLDWRSPWALADSTIYSTNLGRLYKLFPKMHSIGHALTVVKCPAREEVISQTGEPADFLRILSETQFLSGALLRKYQGSLQDADDALKEIDARKKVTQYYRYQTLAPPVAETVLSTVHPDPDKIAKTAPFDHMPAVVQLDMEIDTDQCDAVFAWLDAYKKKGAQTSYGVHFAPWLLEGGGCGSVAVTAAFWTTGAEWKTAACDWSIPLKIGSARIAFGNEGINGTYPQGSLLQNGNDVWPPELGAVSKFKDLGVKWTDATMKAWTGDNDYQFNDKFAKKFVPMRIIDPTAIVTAVKTAWQLSFKNRMPGTELFLLGQKWQIVTDPAPFKHIHISRSIVGQKPRKVDVDKDPKVCP